MKYIYELLGFIFLVTHYSISEGVELFFVLHRVQSMVKQSLPNLIIFEMHHEWFDDVNF